MTLEPTTEPVEPVEPVEATRPSTPRVSPAAVAATPRGDRWFRLLLVAALVIAVGGVTFAVGRLTAPASTASTGRNGNGFFDRGGAVPSGALPSGVPGFGRGGLGGSTTISGTVESIADGTLTIKLADGTSVSVALSGTTTYHSQAAATAGEVTTGTKVAVQVQFGGAGANPSASPGTNGGGRTFSATDVTVVP